MTLSVLLSHSHYQLKRCFEFVNVVNKSLDLLHAAHLLLFHSLAIPFLKHFVVVTEVQRIHATISHVFFFRALIPH